MPFRFFEPMIMSYLKVDIIERGRVLCSMKFPPRLQTPFGCFVYCETGISEFGKTSEHRLG
ncbi:hypothetical protein LXL04_015666 [Taraxacum kok-saghyz]